MIVLVAAANAAPGVSTGAGLDGPAQTAYAPASERAPVVVLISGQTGPASYQTYASEVARLGNLRKTIERAQRSPNAVPGRTAVIGFFLGGGGALAYATTLPDLLSLA